MAPWMLNSNIHIFKVVNDLIIVDVCETLKSSLQYQTLMLLKNSHILPSVCTNNVNNMGTVSVYAILPSAYII